MAAQVGASQQPLGAEQALERRTNQASQRFEQERGRDRSADQHSDGQQGGHERWRAALERIEEEAGGHHDQLSGDDPAQTDPEAAPWSVSRAKGLQWADPSGLGGRDPGREQGDAEPQPEREREHGRVQGQIHHQRGSRAGDDVDQDRSNADPDRQTQGGSEQPQRQPLADDEAAHLAPGGSCGPQQADLAGSLRQGHGQRVGHQEGPGTERDQTEQEGDAREPGLRASEGSLRIGDRFDHERLGQGPIQPRFDLGHPALGDRHVHRRDR